MAVVVIQEVPATPEQYDAVNEKLAAHSDPPAGLLIHTGGEMEGGMRVIDVWESEEAFNTFREERLGPAVAAVVGEEAMAAGPPPTTIYELRDVIKP